MATKEQIIEAANRFSKTWGIKGGYVNTDGAWCSTRNPEQFKKFLEETYGFTVIRCTSTDHCTALAVTACGLEIAWNGYCRKI